MKIVVIDGQGGRLGCQICEAIKKENLQVQVYAVGTNSIATAAMLKAGAQFGATGDNAVLVACRDADVIIGPVGIALADSLLGEISPAMAVAVGQSRAMKLLLPVSHCNNQIIGIRKLSINELVKETTEQLKLLINKKCE